MLALPALASVALGTALPASLLGASAQPIVTVTVGSRASGVRVARNFVGLSFEGEATPLLSRYGRGGTLVRYLRSLGTGVIRVGGVSADKSTAWAPPGTPLPPWASTAVTPEALAGIGALARRTGWSVLWTVNLGHYDPASAAAEAAAADAELGSSLAGVEIGNEPNAYVNEGLRPPDWGLERWSGQVAAYRHAIESAAPGTPIASPDPSTGIRWLPWVRRAALLRPSLLTDHFYPLTSCNYLSPTIAELTGAAVRAGETATLARVAAIARTSGEPLRIDETNDVSCHGEPGVSNSFASALWAVDWIVRAMRAGVAGLNFHDLLDEPAAYSPLVLGRRARLHANPEWYALLMVSRLDGEVPLDTLASADPSLTSGAFLARGKRRQSLNVVLVNFAAPGTTPQLARVRVPRRFRSGTVLRLVSPSPASLSRVTLGGSEVSASGAWRPRLPLPRVVASHGYLTLQIAPSSAVLVTLAAARRG